MCNNLDCVWDWVVSTVLSVYSTRCHESSKTSSVNCCHEKDCRLDDHDTTQPASQPAHSPAPLSPGLSACSVPAHDLRLHAVIIIIIIIIDQGQNPLHTLPRIASPQQVCCVCCVLSFSKFHYNDLYQQVANKLATSSFTRKLRGNRCNGF